MLAGAEHDFEELRQILALPVAVLEEDLRHLQRSLERSPQRLRAQPARCPQCDFRFRLRPGRFATPGRCPQCRNQRLQPVRLRVG